MKECRQDLVVFFYYDWLGNNTLLLVSFGQTACRYFLIECTLAFIVAFVINVSVVVVAGAICSGNNLSSAGANTCGDLTLQSAPMLLRVCWLMGHSTYA